MRMMKSFQEWGEPVYSNSDFNIIVKKNDEHGIAVYWRHDFPHNEHDILTPLLVPRHLGIGMLKSALSVVKSKSDIDKIEKAIRELSE